MGLMYAPHTVTMINAYTQDGETQYAAAVLRGVFLDTTHSTLAATMGTKTSDEAVLFIPRDADTEGKQYMKPKVWEAAEDKQQAWTIREAGASNVAACFFVRGIVPAMSYREACQQYDDVYRVDSVSDRDYGAEDMRHWEVRGR